MIGAPGAGLVSPVVMKTLFDLNVFVAIAARLPQILQNYKVRPVPYLRALLDTFSQRLSAPHTPSLLHAPRFNRQRAPVS